MATEAPTRIVIDPMMVGPTKGDNVNNTAPAGARQGASGNSLKVLKVLEILGVLLGAAGLLFAFIYLVWVVHTFDKGETVNIAKGTWDAWIFVLLAGLYLIPTYLIPKVPFFPIVHAFFVAISWVYLGGTGAAMITACNTVTGVENYCKFVRLGFVGFLFTWVAFISLAIITSLKYRHHFSKY
eukprot:jgi/Chlat1/968/Chrsp108S01387